MTKIAILGDIHVGKLARSSEFAVPGESLQDNTGGAVSMISGLINTLSEERVEFLFVAGDLTTTGNPAEYIRCCQILSEIARSTGIPEPNLIISLGNHDVDWRISDIASQILSEGNVLLPVDDITNTYQGLSAKVGGKCINNNHFNEKGPAPYSGIIERAGMKIFVLNSGWCGRREDEIKHGKLKDDQFDWFSEEAENIKEENVWKILLLHHHPFNYPYPNRGLDISQLQEGSELVEIAGACGFHIVCHGHRHHPKAINVFNSGWRNSITFICSGSLSVNASKRDSGDIPNCFHILELVNQERVVGLKNYAYRSGDGWTQIKYSEVTPQDAEMIFSKPYTPAERKIRLEELVDNLDDGGNIELPSWNNLPLELKTQYYHELNTMVENVDTNKYSVYGKYPYRVALMRRSV